MPRRHLLGRDAPQIEQCEPEGRRQERRLKVHRDHDRDPLRIEGAAINDRPDDGNDDVDDLQEIEDEAIAEDILGRLEGWLMRRRKA